MAQQGIAGSKSEVERLTAWEMCEILSYTAKQIDKEKELAAKSKLKNKKR